jgi:probable phosphoglycerate mutase
MKLILTRHGQTEENKKRIVQGHLPGKLSDLGLEQAKKVAERLKDEKLDHIYSSDLARAADTAKEIAKFHTCPLHFVKELREKDFGKLSGVSYDEIDPHKDTSSEIESAKSMKSRVKLFLDKVYDKYSNKTVLFVAHNSINRALISVITGKDYEEIDFQKNTSISVFEIEEDNNHKVHLLNCINHLD